MTFPKNQQTRRRGQTLGEGGADQPFGFEPKHMLDEHHAGNLVGGDGLRGPDKSQGELRDVDATRGPPQGGSAEGRSAHQDAQHGADVRGKPHDGAASGSLAGKIEARAQGALRQERRPG